MNKQAFPNEQHQNEAGTWNQTFEPGMSLLEYYAGQISPIIFQRATEANENRDPGDQFKPDKINEGVSRFAFTFAEAMIKEAEKRGHLTDD